MSLLLLLSLCDDSMNALVVDACNKGATVVNAVQGGGSIAGKIIHYPFLNQGHFMPI